MWSMTSNEFLSVALLYMPIYDAYIQDFYSHWVDDHIDTWKSTLRQINLFTRFIAIWKWAYIMVYIINMARTGSSNSKKDISRSIRLHFALPKSKFLPYLYCFEACYK